MVRKKRGLAGLLESDQESTGKDEGQKPTHKSPGKHRATPAGLDYMNAGKGRAETNRPTSSRGGRIHEFDPAELAMWPLHNRNQKFLTDERVEGLAEQLKAVGQEQPALGRYAPEGSPYRVELIYGARRLAAARMAGMKLLVEIVDVDDQEALRIMEAENSEREDLSHYEAGVHYKRLLDGGQFENQSDLSRVLGISRQKLTRLLKIAQIPEHVIEMLGSPYEMSQLKLEKLADLLSTNKVDKDDLSGHLKQVALNEASPEKRLTALLSALKKPSAGPKRQVVQFSYRSKRVAEMQGEPGRSMVIVRLPVSEKQQALYDELQQVLSKHGKSTE